MSTASASGEYSKLSLHDKIWNFDVSDPRLHPKGFTIYKITCRFFAIDKPESLTVIVLWKRYNDFKNLYKAMLTLHRALHRRDSFPVFAKPKVFGRFEEAVVEERRQSALALLNFIGTQPHLYKSQVLSKFLADGKMDSSKPALLSPHNFGSGTEDKPTTLDILGSLEDAPAQPAGLGQGAQPNHPNRGENQDKNSEEVNESDTDSSAQQQSLDVSAPKPLEGTWNFPQLPDSISLDSSTGDDDTDTGDMDSILSSSLPDADLSMFDPLRPEAATPEQQLEGSAGMPRTNSWLNEAISTCAHMDDVAVTTAGAEVDSAGSKPRSLTLDSNSLLVSPHYGSQVISGTSIEVKNSGGSIVEVGLGDENFVPPEVTVRSGRSESKVSCGRGDIDLSDVGSSNSHVSSSASSAVSTPSHSARNGPAGIPQSPKTSSLAPSVKTPTLKAPSLSPAKSPAQSPAKARSPTMSSVSTMDLGGKEDYIYLAAGQICLAQNSEATGQYQLAFSYYKTGVGILLQGVQDDANKARRDAVRRKTAQYLMKAEDLYNRHLAIEKLDERRWAADSFVSPSLELDPSFAFIQGSGRELRGFQVLGTIDKNILVLDRSTEETFVIKTIQKLATGALMSVSDSGQRSILPTSCPYMVSLHKFFETDNAIFLLLQYASGGRLWSYIAGYLQQSASHAHATGDCHYQDGGKGNVYMGQKMHEDGNAEVVASREGNESGLGTSKSPNVADSRPKPKPVLSERGVRFSDLRAAVVSPDADVSVTPIAEGSGKENQVSMAGAVSPRDADSTFEDDSFSERRLSSLSSDEFHRSVSQEDGEGERRGKAGGRQSTDEGPDHFQDLLQRNRVNLENFSINSFDSDSHRPGSTVSTGDDVDSSVGAPFSPRCGLGPLSTIPDEVFGEDTTPGSREAGPEEVSDMLESSRKLLQTVERTLSAMEDGEESSSKTPDTLSTSESTSHGQDGRVSTDSDSPEVSIYDSQRLSDDDSVDRFAGMIYGVVLDDEEKTDNSGKGKTDSGPGQHSAEQTGTAETSQESLGMEGSTLSSQTEADRAEAGGCDTEATLSDSGTMTPLTDSQTSQSQTGQAGFAETARASSVRRSRTTSGTSQHSDIMVVPRKVSFNRSTSVEMTRSASFEYDLKSPTRHRGRLVSDLFEQLDGERTDHVVLPEAVVQRWAAEIVIALSRLHAMGIICRDLKPDNILLGEGGHIFLTFFCQVGQLEKEIDWAAVEHMYVAPEVRSISGFDAACDWWSLGALLYELLVGKSLRCCHPEGILPYTNIFIPSHVSNEGRSLLQDLLRYNPRERLGAGVAGAEEIKAHNFFFGIDWNRLEYV